MLRLDTSMAFIIQNSKFKIHNHRISFPRPPATGSFNDLHRENNFLAVSQSSTLQTGGLNALPRRKVPPLRRQHEPAQADHRRPQKRRIPHDLHEVRPHRIPRWTRHAVAVTETAAATARRNLRQPASPADAPAPMTATSPMSDSYLQVRQTL